MTWGEYIEDEYDWEEHEKPDMSDPHIAEDFKMMAEDKYLFNGADRNGDGQLDKVEYLAFTHPEEDPAMKPHVIQQILTEKDADKSGDLTFQEFVGDRGKDKSKEWLEEEKDRFDNELDKNGDNVLNQEEIAAWIIPSNEEIATEEVTNQPTMTLS